MKSLISRKSTKTSRFLTGAIVGVSLISLHFAGYLDYTSHPHDMSGYPVADGGPNVIYIQPFGNLDPFGLQYTTEFLASDTGLEVKVLPHVEVPRKAYDRSDRPTQVDADYIHDSLTQDGVIPDDCFRIIAITSEDLYADNLNFILGLGKGPKDCINSYLRFRPLNPDGTPPTILYDEQKELYRTRIRKLLRHELGHTFNLNHCFRLNCVMRFANSVDEQDGQSEFYCPHCSRIIAKGLTRSDN